MRSIILTLVLTGTGTGLLGSSLSHIRSSDSSFVVWMTQNFIGFRWPLPVSKLSHTLKAGSMWQNKSVGVTDVSSCCWSWIGEMPCNNKFGHGKRRKRWPLGQKSFSEMVKIILLYFYFKILPGLFCLLLFSLIYIFFTPVAKCSSSFHLFTRTPSTPPTPASQFYQRWFILHHSSL